MTTLEQTLDKTVRFEGLDICVIAGGKDGNALLGALFYRPHNGEVPNQEMSHEEINGYLTDNRYARIPYKLIKKIEVDGQPVWMNETNNLYQAPLDNPEYWGRGKVALELRYNGHGPDEVINAIAGREIGFKYLKEKKQKNKVK